MQSHLTYHRELDQLNKKLLTISTLAEDRVRRAAQLIRTRDLQEIESVLNSDREIDELEVEIEEDCLKVLALHQPVAGDLRFIIAVIKINNEIERIADTAVSIAARMKSLTRFRPVDIDFDFKSMAEKTITMLKMSLDALVHRDCDLARRVFLIDNEVDVMKRNAYDAISKVPPNHPDMIHNVINTYLLATHLERIADRATNIAEEVVYLVEGTIIRNNVSIGK